MLTVQDFKAHAAHSSPGQMHERTRCRAEAAPVQSPPARPWGLMESSNLQPPNSLTAVGRGAALYKHFTGYSHVWRKQNDEEMLSP